LLGRWQHIEYVMGFNLDRRLFDVLRCMPTVPGAIGAFRREALSDAGGVSGATLAEDTDLRSRSAARAGAWFTRRTPAPGPRRRRRCRQLWRQRYRWCYGTLQSVWKHRAAIWRHGEGAIGRRGLP
jgi:cellulose synthase/poly-beta-1,6-N-acetylglucosamine synthase-like glycosyltransferase